MNALRLFQDRTATAPPKDGHLSLLTVEQLRAIRNRPRTEAAIRGRCMVVGVDANTALCRVLGRYKMFVDLRDRSFVPHLMFEGYWEYWITAFLWRNVRHGMTVLDLGANHGYYSMLLADLVGPDGHVHAFEPNPRMAELLRDNVAVNGFSRTVSVHECAIGAEDRTAAHLLVPEKDPKNAHLVGFDETSLAAVSKLESFYRVRIATLDATIAQPVDFVKVDIEGSEGAAWQGMQRLIARSSAIGIVMEFNATRCVDAAAILRDMAGRFPLREIPFNGRARPVTAENILARQEDTILYLSNKEPA